VKRICSIFAFVIILSLFLVSPAAAFMTELSGKHVPEEDAEFFMQNCKLERIEKEPPLSLFSCFDVSDSGLIAIGQVNLDEKRVCVYTCTGTFLYGYTFRSDGDFEVEWDGENLGIYFARSDYLVSLSPQGDVLSLWETEHTIENSIYLLRVIEAHDKEVNGTMYSARNASKIAGLLSPYYAKIQVRESDGTERTVYDASAVQNARMLSAAVILLGFLSIGVFVIAKVIVGLNRHNQNAKHSQ